MPKQGGTWLLAAIALMALGVALPIPAPLDHEGGLVPLTADGKAALAVLAFAVVLWVTEALPFPVTALSVMVLLPALGVSSFASVVGQGFGHPIIVFLIGILILAAGFGHSGLGTRLVLAVLRLVGTRTDRVLLGFLSVGALLSMWLNDLAAAALLLPLGVGVLEDAGLRRQESNFGRALMIGCAFGPLIGGVATPAGTGANQVTMGYLRDMAGVELSFLDWMTFGLPATVLMIPCAWRLLLWVFPPELDRLPIQAAELERRQDELGPLSPVERKTLAIFGVTILTWLTTPMLSAWTAGRVEPSMHAVALAGGLAMFLPGVRVLGWKTAQQEIQWGGILLVAAGLALGLTVFETGAARWIGLGLLTPLAVVPTMVQPFVVVIVVSAMHLLFASNTVTATVILPILIALAIDLGLSPLAIAVPAGFASSLAFILVTESPANVILYSAGYFSIRDMARAGVWMSLAAAVCVTIAVTAVLMIA